MNAKCSSRFVGIFLAGAACWCGVWSVGAAAEQRYPNGAIKVVVPYDAGGPTDRVARTITDKLSISLKRPFVIENRPGAGGNIGTDLVAKAEPDGRTLGLVVSTTLTVNPSLYKRLPFDPEKDIRPIAIVATTGLMLAVHPSVPVHSVAEFVAYAKAASASRTPIAYASAGNGTPSHLAMESFRMHAGFEAVQVPYRSVAPMLVDLRSGQVKVGFVGTAGIGHALRGLGVARGSRSPLAPEVPTIAEAGYPGFTAEPYLVVMSPTGIPNHLVELLERELQAVLKLPDVIEQFRLMDMSPVGTIGSEVEARLKTDREAWAKVVARAGMRLD
jgi:tripartite-type tricarboxylate transporter receptor subunit TctC